MSGPLMGLGIVGILALGFLVTAVFLVIAAFRKSTTLGIAAICGIFVILAIPAAGLFLSTARIASDTPVAMASVNRSRLPAPRPSDDNGRATSITKPAPTRSPGVTVEVNSVRRRSASVPPFAKMILAGLSLAALLVLARVATFGRRNGGYGPAARVVAAVAFVGLCVLLAIIQPIL